MKRGYFVCGSDDGTGFAVVAPTAKEAKKIAIVCGDLDADRIDIRVYWQKHAIVDDLPIGAVDDPYTGLVRGLYCHLDEAICEGCGHDRTLHGYNGRALCDQCIRQIESSRKERKNAIIEKLKLGPCTAKELPYRKGGMSARNRRRFCQIQVCGKRTHNNRRCGAFKTIYYLVGDEDRAVALFIEANAVTLANLNLHINSALDVGLPKPMVQKIRAALQ